MNGILIGSVTRAGLILAFFSFLADIVALVRDRVLAAHFGASRTLDIYYSAFKLPDLVFNLLILGAVSSAFIPVFLEYYRDDKKRAWQLANAVLTVGFCAVLIAVVVMFVLAKPLSALIAPGFNEAERVMLVQLIRLMLISPLIFAVSTVVGSILQSLERFFAYAVAPVLYNAGIIVGAMVLAPMVEQRGYPSVLGLGLGVLLGALLHLLVQWTAAFRAGFSFSPNFTVGDVGLRRIIRLMIPRTLGLGAYSIDTMITNAIASTLGAGAITIFTFANNLQFVPIAVVGVSMATAVFPRLSAHASGGELHELQRKLSRVLRATAGIVFAAAVAMFLLREKIIGILFGIGMFQEANVHMTATVLGIFMLGIVAQSLIPTLSRAFYALQNTRTPVIISVSSILLNIGLGLLFTLVYGWGVYGLASAFAISGNIHFLLLYIAFHRRYRN